VEGVKVPKENKTPSENSAIDFMRSLYLLIQTAKVYEDNNQLIKDALGQFKNILGEMTREENLSIQLWRGRFYVGGEKLLYKRENVGIINEMTEYFSQRGIGGLQYFAASREAPPEDLMHVVRLLDASAGQKNPVDWLVQKFSGQGLGWIEITQQKEDDRKDEEKDPGRKRRERAKKAYSHALNALHEVTEKTSRGLVGVRKARRLAQTIVDLVREDKSLILGLSTIKQFDDYTYTHSINVSLLATALGRQIGLSKVALEQLCVRALFHDLGKVEIPTTILHKEGKLSAEEWQTMQNHPVVGVRKILRISANKAMRSKIIQGPFEHHLNNDLTGYPKTHFIKRVSLMGKILRIADVYEALTAERVYRPRSFTPDEALRKMWSEAGKSFDPILLKCFISMMGIYPVGSLVELNDSRTALVIEYPEGSPKDMPIVQILVEDGAGGRTRGETISLAAPLRGAGKSPRLKIVKGIHPSSLGIQVAHFFVEEKKETVPLGFPASASYSSISQTVP
jgi:HD-GYP domain-containing protein (c-di-GMP phosphodiesterase class II)